MESEDYEFYKGLDFLCNNQVSLRKNTGSKL